MIVAVGKLKERGIREAADDYVKRISRYARPEEVELKDLPPAELEEKFARAIPERSRVIALEVDGKPTSSEGFAQTIARAEGEGVASICFLIGGAHGLPPAVSARAHHRLSLSQMTLPHRLARLLLLEQIYRAYTILRGEPYSH